MLICSGKGVVTTKLDGTPEVRQDLPSSGLQGTLITIVFKQSLANDGFQKHLHEAKEKNGLLQTPPNSLNIEL